MNYIEKERVRTGNGPGQVRIAEGGGCGRRAHRCGGVDERRGESGAGREGIRVGGEGRWRRRGGGGKHCGRGGHGGWSLKGSEKEACVSESTSCDGLYRYKRGAGNRSSMTEGVCAHHQPHRSPWVLARAGPTNAMLCPRCGGTVFTIRQNDTCLLPSPTLIGLRPMSTCLWGANTGMPG